jgi:hypothetical protein
MRSSLRSMVRLIVAPMSFIVARDERSHSKAAEFSGR